jgi:cellulose synthase (UDP-forming)
MDSFDRLLGLVTVGANSFYIFWLFNAVRGPLGLALAVAEAMIFSLSALFLVNHWRQKPIGHPKSKAAGSLDVFLTVVDEPTAMFEPTLKAAVGIDYAEKTVYVLDDGGREDIRKLAGRYSAVYLSREVRCNRKAGNLNFGLENSKGEFILVLDADQTVNPEIARDLLGYFRDDDMLAMVTTRQSFRAPLKDFNHDNLFYEEMQVGKNTDNAAISCGSGVFYRRSAIAAIGGFQTWNIVEDLTTSYVLHQGGYRSLYVSRPYTIGTAPMDLKVIYKQRGTWALDTLRLFFHWNPLFAKGLTVPQRLHYFEIAWAYIVSALALPVVFLLPPLTLIFNVYIIPDPATYVAIRLPTILLIVLFYFRLSENTFQTSQYWAALSPVYLKSMVDALRIYDVKRCSLPHANPKSSHVRPKNVRLILPHIAYIAFGLAAIAYRVLVDGGVTGFIAINAAWVAVMVFWFAPVIHRELMECHYCSFEDVMDAGGKSAG